MNVSRQTSSRECSGYNAMMTQRIIINENQRKLKKHRYWGAANLCLLGIVLYDIMHTCPINPIWSILYLEYVLSVVFFLNMMFNFICYTKISLNSTSIDVTSEQKQLLGFKDHDSNYTVTDTKSNSPSLSRRLSPFRDTPNASLSNSNTPMNWSALSWGSNMTSFNDSKNCVHSSPSYSSVRPSLSQYSPYSHSGSPYDHQSSPNVSLLNLTPYDTSGGEVIKDEQSLRSYLKGYHIYENSANVSSPTEQSTSLLSTFWSHPAAKNNDEAPSFLRRCQYQLSPLSTGSSSSSPSGKSDDKGSPANSHLQGMEMWRRLQVDTVTLTQWNANIRMWISQTIVERLVKEIDFIDDALQKQGLGDVRVGGVGLDRLRKTAQMAPVLQYIPTLSTLIPFLEISTNQEYLVKRIRELAKGGCMSNFKWNGGSTFDGKEWNDSFPTDSAIIMHLFATYMDTQLLPMPNKPDVKPFSGNHYIKFSERMPVLSHTTLAIHQFSEKPPHYRVVVGEEVFEMVKGYNNLFHSILLFVYQVNKKEHGMLGRINLGKSGINILWVIDS